MIRFMISIWLKFFFVLTPFFALSMFLSLTRNYSTVEKRVLAWRVIVATVVLSLLLFFFGNAIFAVFGITLDSFRVGSGILLFLSAITLINSTPVTATVDSDQDQDIAIVPLAIPVVVGPATVGTILVLSAEIEGLERRIMGVSALVLALFSLGAFLLLADKIEGALGRRNLNILSKVTGLILSALAAQMVMAGVRHFFMQA